MIANIITKFQIPDPKRPIPCEGRKWGPSGALQPFTPPLLLPEHVLGRVVREISASVGTYGMGGPGFFGLRLGDEWLVISIRGAAEWILVDDRLVMDTFGDKYERPEP